MKAIAKVEVRSDFTCSWDVPHEIRRACSTTRPPREWATKITGREVYDGELVERWDEGDYVLFLFLLFVTKGLGRETSHDRVQCFHRRW